MNSILMGALAGAVGGLVGAGVAWIAARFLRRTPKWLPIVPALFAVAAVSLARAQQPNLGDQMMAGLDKTATVQALKTHYPKDYQRLETRVRGASAPSDAGAAFAEIFADVMMRQRPLADAEQSYALFQVSLDEGRALRRIDPMGCALFLDGRGAPASLAKVLTPRMQARDEKVAAQVLAQAATKPAALSAPMPLDDLIALSVEAVATLPDADQKQVAAIFTDERDPQTPEEGRVMCDFNIARAEAILARPKPVAGAMVRAIWAMK